MWIKKEKNIIKYEFEEVLLGLEELDNKNMVTYFPIFLLLVFFCLIRRSKIKKIKDIYNEMVVAEK